ncbi:unnamed protein product, partial [Brachionus calyciflorus]
MEEDQVDPLSNQMQAECIELLSNISVLEWHDKSRFEALKIEFIKVYKSNLSNGFVRVDQKTLCNSLLKINIDALKALRNDLSNELLGSHKLTTTLVLKAKRSPNTITEDIFRLSHYLCSSNLTEDDLLTLFNKTNFNQNLVQTNDNAPHPLNHDDFEDLFLSIEDIKEETNQLNNNYSTLSNNQHQMTVMIQNQMKLLNKLFDENKLLKDTVGRLEKMISSLIENKSNSNNSPTQQSSQKTSTQNPTHSFSTGYISPFYPPLPSSMPTRCPGPNMATIPSNPQTCTNGIPRFSQPIRPMSFAESVQNNQVNNGQDTQKTGKRSATEALPMNDNSKKIQKINHKNNENNK